MNASTVVGFDIVTGGVRTQLVLNREFGFARGVR